MNGNVLEFGWPEAQWNWPSEGDYSTLEWHSTDIQKPTEQEIIDKQAEYEAYLENAQPAYPSETILKSPNGQPFKVTVNDDGSLETEEI